ncbi:MAG: hypothetical protein HYX48_03680 [Chlamydiales bacterium]|nr:hypothetical protein [Chlamydiales bacterium]
MHDVDSVLPHILSYCEREIPLTRVSKAFRAAMNHVARDEVGLKILMQCADLNAKMEEECRRFLNPGESFPQAVARLKAQFFSEYYIQERLATRLDAIYVQQFNCLIEQVARYEGEVPIAREGIFFGEMNAALEKLYAPDPIADRYPVWHILEKFLIQASLSRRVKEVHATTVGGDPFPHEGALVRLGELEKSQHKRVAAHPRQNFLFWQVRGQRLNLFKEDRFQRQEEGCVELQLEEDLNFTKFWEKLKAGHPAIFPNDRRTVNERREWLNDQANAEQLRQIESLYLGPGYEVSILPKEVVRLPCLKTLYLSSGIDDFSLLHALPNELPASLKNLELCFTNFEKIPDVLATGAFKVTFCYNQKRAILSEAIARHQCSGIRSHVEEFIWNSWTRPFNIVHRQDSTRFSLFMGLKPGIELKEIPFFLWFRDTYSARYTYEQGVWFFKAIGAVESATRGLTEFSPFLEPLAALMYGVAFGALIWTFLPFIFLTNFTLLIYNLLLDYTVLPVVTLYRNFYGYSPMVRLPDPRFS